jgi:F-type H+-transporting ATPase subunit a
VSFQAGVPAEDGVPFPPSVDEFFPPSLVDGLPWLTKYTVMVWIAVALVLMFFMVFYRNPKIVPTRGQWLAESFYGFTRNNIAGEMIGHEGIRFAPYLTTLFAFLILTNLFGILPFVQFSPNSHIAFPVIFALTSYVLFIAVGIRRHGVAKYFKIALIPPAPWFILILLVPIEFISTFLVRPFTLAVRLFANMFAGHVILLVFTLGGFVLLSSDAWAIKSLSLVSFAFAIAMTFLEAFVAILQAYVFVMLTSSYVQGALAEGH